MSKTFFERVEEAAEEAGIRVTKEPIPDTPFKPHLTVQVSVTGEAVFLPQVETTSGDQYPISLGTTDKGNARTVRSILEHRQLFVRRTLHFRCGLRASFSRMGETPTLSV